MKNLLLDVRIHGLVAVACFVIVLVKMIADNITSLSELPIFYKVLCWVFGLIVVGNVGARVVMAWVIYPIIKLYTNKRK